MIIGCLGWGSLIWDRRDLEIRGDWFTDGPLLPVEFCRRSGNGRITLVIVAGKPRVRTLWTIFVTDDIGTAVEQLRVREGIRESKEETWIGKWVAGEKNSGVDPYIAQWAEGMILDAILWTALPPKFEGEDGEVKDGIVPSSSDVVQYLLDLPIGKHHLAKEYVCRTPPQIDTDYRMRIERDLGWTPQQALSSRSRSTLSS